MFDVVQYVNNKWTLSAVIVISLLILFKEKINKTGKIIEKLPEHDRYSLVKLEFWDGCISKTIAIIFIVIAIVLFFLKPESLVLDSMKKTEEEIVRWKSKKTVKISYDEAAKKYVHYVKNKNYNGAWKYIGKYYHRNNLNNNKYLKSITEVMSFDQYKREMDSLKSYKLVNISATNKTIEILSTLKTGKQELSIYGVKKDIKLKESIGGWYIFSLLKKKVTKSVKLNNLLEYSDWRDNWKKNAHIYKDSIKILTPKGQLVLDEPKLPSDSYRSYYKENFFIENAKGYIITKEGKFFMTQYSWDKVNEGVFKYPKWIFILK